jgi:hypothetical protein
VLLLSWLCAGLLARQSRAFAVHQGCYETVEADARAFPFKAAAANDMTVEACRCVSLLPSSLAEHVASSAAPIEANKSSLYFTGPEQLGTASIA